jgi:D-amino peptidase
VRLFISADMEGVAGAVTYEQLLPGGAEYEQARKWMTDEVTTLCETAFEAGVEEIVVADAHGTGQNIIPDQLPEEVELIRAWPRPLGMMEGIDDGHFDGAVLLGYHAGAHTPGGNSSHTMLLMIRELRLNGTPVSETGLSVAIAAHFGVPVIMVTGDDVYIKHALECLGDVETVTTKQSYSWFSGRVITPQKSRKLLADGLRSALTRIEDFSPQPMGTPVNVELELANHVLVESLCFLDYFERVNSHTLRFKAKDMLEVSRFFAFFQNINSGAWSRMNRTW